MDDIERLPVGRRDRAAAGLAAGIALLLALFVLPKADLRLAEWHGITVFFLAPAALATAVTAFLFERQARLTNSVPVAILASGYGAAAALMVAFLLAFPEAIGPGILPIAQPGSSAWLWIGWHAGFLAFLMLYAAAAGDVPWLRPVLAQRHVAGILAVATTAVTGTFILACLRFGANFPAIAVQGHRTAMYELGILPLLVVEAVLTIAVLGAATRLRTVTDLWLAVVALATGIDVPLTALSSGGYSLGWYVARTEQWVASAAMLFIFIAQFDRIYARIVSLNQQLAEQALIDGLTGVRNRRGFDQRFADALAVCIRDERPIALLLIDVDNFKAFNDAYGHPAGDECLRRIVDAAQLVAGRARDTVARIGGEEFTVILPETEIDGALEVAERLRTVVETLALPQGRDAEHPVVTVSVGVCVARKRDQMVAEVMHFEADRALYLAKASGRNCVKHTEGALARFQNSR